MKTKKILLLAAVGSMLVSCEEYLDVKPDKKLVVPATLQDMNALLDNTFMNSYSVVGDVAADDYYHTAADWNGLTNVRDRNIYLWQNNAVDGDGGVWSGRYSIVAAANVVLEATERKPPGAGEQNEWNRVKAAALFFRGYAFYDLAELFAKPYDKNTANTDLGIPLRLRPDINEKTVRASVAQTYDQIVKDLRGAAQLLPATSSIATRPDKAAAYGALARVHLSMGLFEEAGKYADSSLTMRDELLDFNSLNVTAAVPFSRLNKEVIFHSTGSASNFAVARCRVDSTLLQSYASNDLRKALFFRQNADKTYAFKGSYDGQSSSVLFNGMTTAEMYLIRAEGFARTGKVNEAVADLNRLLEKRWKKGTFVPITASTGDEALNRTLEERRKELTFKGRRWADLRRLNKESGFAKTVVRVMNGETYELAPNDKRYVFPIPEDVIQLSGIKQNER